MTNSHLKLITPNSEIRTVTPRRPKNADVRTREHLTPGEVEQLIEAARGNRNGHRDATMILMACGHGFRAAELIDLRWDQIDFRGAVLHTRRLKGGTPSTAKFSDAQTWHEWLTSKPGADAIASYRINDMQVFFPLGGGTTD